jgi:hypothetical protein
MTNEELNNTKQAIQALKDVLLAKIEEFQRISEEQKNREMVINSIKTTIEAISHSDKTPSSNKGSVAMPVSAFYYPLGSSWKEKIIAFLKFKNKAVTTTEICKAISDIEPKYSQRQLLNHVSGNMSLMVKDGFIRVYKPTKMKGSYYANPAWFEGENLKEQHKPDMKAQVIW